jgi:hypothetical protein
VTFPDDLRTEAARHDDPVAGMLTASAWHIERLVQRLATATGQPEGAVRLSEGLGDPGGTKSRENSPQTARGGRDA